MPSAHASSTSARTGVGLDELLLRPLQLFLYLRQLFELLGCRLSLDLRLGPELVHPRHDRAPALVGGKPGVRNTTLSVEASAEFSIRLAPGQDVETIGAAAERLLRDAAPAGAELEISWQGANPGVELLGSTLAREAPAELVRIVAGRARVDHARESR